MKRFLLLGRCELDVKWLEIDSKGNHVRHCGMVQVIVYKEMPEGYVGPAKGYTVNAEFAPMSLKVEPGTWLPIIPAEKLPPPRLTVVLDSP